MATLSDNSLSLKKLPSSPSRFFSSGINPDPANSSRQNVPPDGTIIPKKLEIRKRLFGTFLFLTIFCLVLAGCENGKQTRKNGVDAPNPPHGRSADTAIKSQTSADFSGGKTIHDPNAGMPAAPFDWPPNFVRIAMLPIYTRVPTAGALTDLDEIFRAELAKALPLEIVTVSRLDLLAAIGVEQIESTSIIPQKLIQFLQAKYAVQGVVFTDMPVYRPYRPINIGVRSKLVHIPSMDIMWSADGILDSAEPGIAASAVAFALGNLKAPGKGSPDVILQSPRRYAAFVAHGLYGTIPGQAPTSGPANAPQYPSPSASGSKK